MISIITVANHLRSSTTLSAGDGRGSASVGGVALAAAAGQVSTVCHKCKQSLVNIIR